MQKDFKVGMMVGMVALLAAVVWLSTRQGLGTQARLERTHGQLLARQRPNHSASPATVPSEPNDNAGAPLAQETQPDAPERPLTPPSQKPFPLRNTPVETRQKIKTNLLHIVRSGETLSEIAQDYLGSSRHWRRLLEANRQVLTDPNKIRPGMKIVVPRE
ncbi:MAG: LysM peptidoglycan-binding domain-containing protein [Planctomycetes bacterium]|nr:LysM peptidoglycan-binding domain-containing protein [Planctomycetota bacterium]